MAISTSAERGLSKSKGRQDRKDFQAAKERRQHRRDAILPMREPYMQQIVSGQKTYEYRRNRIDASIERMCFYRTAPHSYIEYICETLSARTRGPGNESLGEDGLGNKMYNDRHRDYEGYDYAFKIVSVYKLDRPLTLLDLRTTHGMKSAPRGLVDTPSSVMENVEWKGATRLL